MNLDPIAKAGQVFINRVVDALPHQMVEGRSVVYITDVHTGAFPNCLKPFQDLDILGAVLFFTH
jgi:hypothetical protein